MANRHCPICKSADYEAVETPHSVAHPTVEDFKITDAGYGKTGPLFRCSVCGFLFVVFPKDTTEYYLDMQDDVYEQGRDYRAKQQKCLLQRLVKAFPKVKSILDVGAGTGMLVEEAGKQGLDALGVEPSTWCAQKAQSHGLKVLQGTLPHKDLEGRLFDVVALVDVIEHVSDPVSLLNSCAEYLQPAGKILLVTPDVASTAARIFGHRWWHYRIAHVGYFSRKTLELALTRTGFKIISTSRPSWYFEIGYLFERLQEYLPIPSLHKSSNRLVKSLLSIQIPFNPGDSLEVMACKT